MELFTEGETAGTESVATGVQSNLPVNVIKLKEEPLESNLNITGSLIPNEIVNLRPEVNGLVEKITFKEGQFVKKGTPLLYLSCFPEVLPSV